MARRLKDLLKAYSEYTKESDSPEVFHLWVSLGTIAGAAQRKIFMRAKTFYVHSNMYVVLVSPPGRGHKGAALNTGKNFLRGVESINFASESGSFEAMATAMSKITNPAHQSLTLFSMELGTLMSTNAGTMITFLTDIYDGNADWSRNTMANSLQLIKKPWLNIMAGTTPKWLGENIGLIALEGGLTARCIFPYSEARLLNNPWPDSDDYDEGLFQAITNDLAHIATLEGEFRWEGGKHGPARTFYDGWYRDAARFPPLDDPRTSTYYDRKHIHILKVAMALSLSYKDELVLTEEDIRRALALLDATEPGMKKALSSAGKNEWATDALRVLAQIRVKGQVSYRDLLVANFHNLGKKNLDSILEELRVSGRIRYDGAAWVAAGVAGLDD